jgi:uncharacterized protein (TIGR03000 family)
MYSVILMAAITTSTAEAPTFHKRSFGCTGGMFLHSGCYGSSCMGFSGGCHGGGAYGWSGGFGGGCVGCWGCMGCYGVYNGPVMTPAGNPMTAPPVTPPAPKPDTSKSAQLIIEKPADATIYVDNQPVKSEGTMQSFATPILDPSQAYYYMVRVEMTRDGKPVSESRKVVVRSGQTIQAIFNEQAIVTTSLKP